MKRSMFQVGLLAVSVMLFAQGCKSPDLKDKAVMLDGTSSINIINTSYDPATGQVSPAIDSIINSGTWSSVPIVGDNIKDYLHYSLKSSGSIWNAKCVTTQQMLIFSTGNKELMASVLATLQKAVEQSDKLKADASDSTTPK
jgi:hypothetical protein